MSLQKNKQVTRGINEDTIPTTPEEAIQVLDALLVKEDKEWLVTEENAAIKVHHSLGRWIRNNWGLWADNPNELKTYFINKGVTHPDDMSGKILDAYVKYLKSNGLTKEELAMVLPKPFNYFALNGSIDYRCSNDGDHEYLKKLGYELKLNPNCTYTCENIPWFQFSCYGWGTMFDNTTDEGRQIFHDMWVAGFIRLWRGRTYTFDGKTVEYNSDTNKFMMCDHQTHDWVEINNPFENDTK